MTTRQRPGEAQAVEAVARAEVADTLRTEAWAIGSEWTDRWHPDDVEAFYASARRAVSAAYPVIETALRTSS